MYLMDSPLYCLSHLDEVVSALEEPEEVSVGVEPQLFLQDLPAELKVDALIADIVSDEEFVAQDDYRRHKTSQGTALPVNASQIADARILPQQNR